MMTGLQVEDEQHQIVQLASPGGEHESCSYPKVKHQLPSSSWGGGESRERGIGKQQSERQAD